MLFSENINYSIKEEIGINMNFRNILFEFTQKSNFTLYPYKCWYSNIVSVTKGC